MAIFHYSVHRVVSRGAGRSAVRSAAYLCREKLRDERTGFSYDYRPKEHAHESAIERASAYIDRADGFAEGRKAALFTGLYGPPDAPEWTRGREHIGEFWNRLEQFEKHERAQLAVPIDIALPCELTLDQNRVLIQDHIRERFTRQGFVVQLAIHAPERGEDRNVHAHLLVSTRQVDEHGFVASKAQSRENFLHRSEYVQNLREHWERTTNRHLARHGHEIRIDRRTLREQGIERAPTLHRGPWRDAAEREVSRMERERQALDRAAEQRHEREQPRQAERQAPQQETSRRREVDRGQQRQDPERAPEQARTTDPFAAARAFWREQAELGRMQQERPAPEQQPERGAEREDAARDHWQSLADDAARAAPVRGEEAYWDHKIDRAHEEREEEQAERDLEQEALAPKIAARKSERELTLDELRGLDDRELAHEAGAAVIWDRYGYKIRDVTARDKALEIDPDFKAATQRTAELQRDLAKLDRKMTDLAGKRDRSLDQAEMAERNLSFGQRVLHVFFANREVYDLQLAAYEADQERIGLEQQRPELAERVAAAQSTEANRYDLVKDQAEAALEKTKERAGLAQEVMAEREAVREAEWIKAREQANLREIESDLEQEQGRDREESMRLFDRYKAEREAAVRAGAEGRRWGDFLRIEASKGDQEAGRALDRHRERERERDDDGLELGL